MQPKNLIPVFDFKGEAEDRYLDPLLKYLISLKQVKDLRVKITEDFYPKN
jgi:hypothetical protein